VNYVEVVSVISTFCNFVWCRGGFFSFLFAEIFDVWVCLLVLFVKGG